jgi:hypothetical protein
LQRKPLLRQVLICPSITDTMATATPTVTTAGTTTIGAAALTIGTITEQP